MHTLSTQTGRFDGTKTNESNTPKELNMPIPLIIYHANCADGFGAAWTAWRHFNREAELLPALYNKEPPDVNGREVYVVDFSYPIQTMLSMAVKAKSYTVIDHHKTALDAVVEKFGIPREEFMEGAEYFNDENNFTFNFDMRHSGAILAWKYFFGTLPPPELLLHIEDRDLWKFELPNTRPVLSALFSYDQDIIVWDELMSANLEELAHEGKAIERKYQKDVKDIARQTQRMGWVGGYNVPVANCPGQFASDVGNLLATGHSFAATYYDTDDGRKFSLRSLKDGGLDVAAIAQQFGGGGHRNAAGFSVIKEHELATL